MSKPNWPKVNNDCLVCGTPHWTCGHTFNQVMGNMRNQKPVTKRLTIHHLQAVVDFMSKYNVPGFGNDTDWMEAFVILRDELDSRKLLQEIAQAGDGTKPAPVPDGECDDRCQKPSHHKRTPPEMEKKP
jgi:hypothetical protein